MNRLHRSVAQASGIAAVLLAVLALAGCGKTEGVLLENERPFVELSAAPSPSDSVEYAVRLNWFGGDNDGVIVRYEYANDPSADGDTTWTSTTSSEVTLLYPSKDPRDNPLPPFGQIVPSSDYHTFVIRAIDNEGAVSAPVSRSFTSWTVAPSTNITRPVPNNQQPVSTTPSITIEWQGTDPDGVLSQRPVKYKYKIVPGDVIDPSNPGALVTAGRIQEYFGADAVNFFASWDSVAGDTLSKFYEGLTPQTIYYFAIVAFDEAGAYEPRFNYTSNVLAFRPTLNKLGPAITVFNEFFSRRQSTGGISLAESRIVKLEFPADAQLTFNWTADPPTGALINGYRWCVDIADQDIRNETPRTDDDDVNHWSAWSLNETSCRIGPFRASTDTVSTHYFYLEARDNLGFISLYTIRLTIVKPSFANPLLVIDDMYGTATENAAGGGVRIVGSYPMEAEQDSFYYARGGFVDSLYLRGGLGNFTTEPGSFAEFAPDTVDYRFYNVDGIDLQLLSNYRLVTWYTDNTSASRTGNKFGTLQPSTAIRQINSINRLNTFAVYLRQGGKAFILGEGMTVAIANGYWGRVSPTGSPTLPYTAGEDQRQNVLFPGNFLYDFIHLRSELNVAGGSNTTLTGAQQLKSAIPYLPQFSGPASQSDRSRDPRILGIPASGTASGIAMGSYRTAENWNDLPQLTQPQYRLANANPALRSFNYTWVITQPNFITSGPPSFLPAMDTLYLCQARDYDPNRARIPPSDGFPNGVHYYGTENGPGSELVWLGFPLYIFEKEQARQVVRAVMRNLGVTPAAPSMRGAQPAGRTGTPRVVDGGETIDTRRAGR